MTKADEITIMKWTIAMEAEGEPFEGKLAVAHVIMNRSLKWRNSIANVCLGKLQFSAWNTDSPTRMRLDDISDKVMEESYQAAIQVYEGKFQDDLTGGATHYLNVPLTKHIRGGTLPEWVNHMTKTMEIGRHTFYKET